MESNYFARVGLVRSQDWEPLFVTRKINFLINNTANTKIVYERFKIQPVEKMRIRKNKKNKRASHKCKLKFLTTHLVSPSWPSIYPPMFSLVFQDNRTRDPINLVSSDFLAGNPF